MKDNGDTEYITPIDFCKYLLLGFCLIPFVGLLINPFFYGMVYIVRRILKIK